jgi:RNA polymerase sigma-70 factor (ECF subfamily)
MNEAKGRSRDEASRMMGTVATSEAHGYASPELSVREVTALQVRAAKTDPSAFEALYRGHADPVFRYCCRRVGSRELAADLTSQIFIKAFTSLHACDDDRFRSWLFSIARNVLIDEFRSRRPLASLDEAFELAAIDPSPEDAVIQQEDRATLLGLLAHLTPDQRQVVELRLAGLNGNEIAEVLGRSRASVDTAQSRAVTRLREVMRRERREETHREAHDGSA